MGQNYYYLVSSLPTLNFGEFKTVPVEDLLEKIYQNVSPIDRERVEYLRKIRDLHNIHARAEEWFTFRSLGNIPLEHLTDTEIELELPEEWHVYILSQKGEKPISIDILWLNYFNESKSLKNSFINTWIEFERALRTAVAIIRQENPNLSSTKTISGVVQSDENAMIQEIVQNSRLPNFGVSHLFDWADQLRELFQDKNPYEFELALDRFRWDFLDTCTSSLHFASEVVLAYVIKLLICDRWKRLDQPRADMIIQKILGGTSGEE